MTTFLNKNFKVTVSLNGNNMGVFQKKSGGGVSASVTSVPPGGMSPPEVVSAPPDQLDAITLIKPYTTSDHDKIDTWYAAVGKGNCTVKEQPLDANGAAYGTPVVSTGILQNVQRPDPDATSTDAAMLTIVIQPGGSVTS